MDTGREASHTGVCQGEIREGQRGVGSWGEIAWGEMPDIGDGEANHTAMCVPMQQSCMFCTCTPKPKMQLKKTDIGIFAITSGDFNTPSQKLVWSVF